MHVYGMIYMVCVWGQHVSEMEVIYSATTGTL